MASVTTQVQVGQKVSVTEVESGCRLTVVEATASGLTVVETAPDYLVLEDMAGEVKTRIPSYLIRGISAPTAAVEAAPVAAVEAPAVPVAAEPIPVVAMPAALAEAA